MITAALSFSSLLQLLPGQIAQGMIWGIMAIGVYITFKILNIADLSVDGTMCLGGAVCIMLVSKGYNVAVAMLIATLAGVLAGCATGIFHTIMGIPAILAGIITQFGLWSVNLKIMGSSNISVNSRSYALPVGGNFLKQSTYNKFPFYKNTIFMLAIFVIVLIAILYWFFGTERGASIRATGCNQNMSRAQGINTSVNTVVGLALSNGIVAFSSALLSQYTYSADINQGRGAIVIGLAAVVIGGAIFDKIFKNFALKLVGVIIGGIIYFIVLGIVTWLNFDTDLLKLLQAIVVAVFLAVPYWKKTFFAKPLKKEEKTNA